MLRNVVDASIAPAVAAASAALLLVLLTAGFAAAQPVAIPDTWGGDFWSRPRLTGGWGGFRDQMGKKGVALDISSVISWWASAGATRTTCRSIKTP